MFYLSVAVVLAFLSDSEAVLPSVGKCSFMEYYCDALKCETDFIKRLQKDPNGDCSAKFSKLFKCVKKTVDICAGDVLSDSTIDRLVRENFKESSVCVYGGLQTPRTSVRSPCRSSFNVKANNCTKKFHQKFTADKSDPSLCQERANARKCLKRLIASDCYFSGSDQEALDLALSDYNPFCANNRDPGATGKDICYGVKDLNNPLNDAGGIKSSVLQAFLFPLLLLFLIKV